MADATESRAQVLLITPSPRGSRNGNRTTALRWASHLRCLGHRVRVRERWCGERCDVLVAIHAVKSADSVLAALARDPELPIVLLLAGTDIEPAFAPTPAAAMAVARAAALVALHPLVADLIPAALRARVHVVEQAATAPPSQRRLPFRAVVLAHLRPVKDPLLPLRALALLPPTLPFELRLAGRALSPDLAAAVTAATAADPRARWLGELPRRAARALLADSHVCIVPSTAEGGANVVSEAIAAGTPLLVSAVPGNLGLLGNDWPATFPAGDAAALAQLLHRTATEPAFWQLLHERTRTLQPKVAPVRERAAIAALLRSLPHRST
jgi:putative glycosyltransferase (TIGR04348 family)